MQSPALLQTLIFFDEIEPSLGLLRRFDWFQIVYNTVAKKWTLPKTIMETFFHVLEVLSNSVGVRDLVFEDQCSVPFRSLLLSFSIR